MIASAANRLEKSLGEQHTKFEPACGEPVVHITNEYATKKAYRAYTSANQR